MWIVFAQLVSPAIHSLSAEISMNAWKIHAAPTQYVSTRPAAMTANAGADSLEIRLPCAHRFKPMLDVKIQMIACAVTLSLAHRDIDARMADA